MWVGSMTLEYVNYTLWASQADWDYLFIIDTFRLKLEIWVILALCAEIIVHPKNIQRKHCSS